LFRPEGQLMDVAGNFTLQRNAKQKHESEKELAGKRVDSVMLVQVLLYVEDTVPAIKVYSGHYFSEIHTSFAIALVYCLLVELRYSVKLNDNL
jgi:hypothetical protein